MIGHGSPSAQLATSMVTARLSLLALEVHQLRLPSSTYSAILPPLPIPSLLLASRDLSANSLPQLSTLRFPAIQWMLTVSMACLRLPEWFGQIAKEVNERLEEENMVRYERLRDIKNKEFHDIIEKLMDANILGGDGSDPTGNEDIIDLSHDMVRTLVLEYRGGAFDRKLKAVGMEPAVKD